jgi:hypothetical protein
MRIQNYVLRIRIWRCSRNRIRTRSRVTQVQREFRSGSEEKSEADPALNFSKQFSRVIPSFSAGLVRSLLPKPLTLPFLTFLGPIYKLSRSQYITTTSSPSDTLKVFQSLALPLLALSRPLQAPSRPLKALSRRLTLLRPVTPLLALSRPL